MSSCVMLDVKFIGITYPDVNGNDFSCLFDQFRIGVFQVVFFLHCLFDLLFVNPMFDVVFIKLSYVNHK